MKEKALEFYRQDDNCCQCILKACEYKYNVNVPQEVICMCQGISSGFGIGCMCSLLVAGIMIFGIMFDEITVKRMRIKLLNAFIVANGDLNCRTLLNKRGDKSNCEELISETVELICALINEELGSTQP